MITLIKGGILIYGGSVKREDILIENGKIKEIKPVILPRGYESVIDGSPFYILPGFIGTADAEGEQGIQNGVTTEVRPIRYSELKTTVDDQIAKTSVTTVSADFVYRVSLPELSKEILQLLDEKRIKVIETDWRNVDWRLWESRLARTGMVLDVMEGDFSNAKHLSLPILTAYGKWKKTSRKRTVFRIRAAQHPSWNRFSATLDPLVIRSYWLDVQDCLQPKLAKEQEIERFLLMISNIRGRIPARLFGIYPKKGSLHIGADADLVLASKERLLSGKGNRFVPDRIMVRGIWLDSDYKEISSRLEGVPLKGNQTYAYSY